MANRKDEEVPTREEILAYILEWSKKPIDPILAENQYTAKRLAEESKHSIEWSQDKLYEMYKEGLCDREMVFVRKGRAAVYTFEEIPKFSS